MNFKSTLSSAVESKLRANVSNIRSSPGRLQFRCPLCGDSKKSRRKARCNYYTNSGTFYCFNCSGSGDGIYLLSHLLHRPYHDIKSELLSSSNLKLSSAIQTASSQIPRKIELDILKINDEEKTKRQFALLTQDLPEEALQYLESRYILDAPFIDSQFKFYWSIKAQRLVIPWYYQNHIIYYQGRTLDPKIDPKYIFPRGYHTLFFGLNSMDFSIPYVFFLEGAFNSMFVKNGIALGSLNVSGLQDSIIKNLFNKHEKIYMFDNPFVDESAKKRMLKMIKGGYQGKFFLPPKELRQYKDPNDAVIATKNPSLYSSLDFLLQNSFGPAKVLAELMPLGH